MTDYDSAYQDFIARCKKEFKDKLKEAQLDFTVDTIVELRKALKQAKFLHIDYCARHETWAKIYMEKGTWDSITAARKKEEDEMWKIVDFWNDFIKKTAKKAREIRWAVYKEQFIHYRNLFQKMNLKYEGFNYISSFLSSYEYDNEYKALKWLRESSIHSTIKQRQKLLTT